MTFDEWAKIATLVIEFVKVAAWPAIAILLAWLLRDELTKIANRLLKIGLTGAEFAPPIAIPEQVPSPPSTGLPEIKGELNTTEKPDTITVEGKVDDTSKSVEPYIAEIKAHISEDQLARAVAVLRTELSTK